MTLFFKQSWVYKKVLNTISGDCLISVLNSENRHIKIDSVKIWEYFFLAFRQLNKMYFLSTRETRLDAKATKTTSIWLGEKGWARGVASLTFGSLMTPWWSWNHLWNGCRDWRVTLITSASQKYSCGHVDFYLCI